MLVNPRNRQTKTRDGAPPSAPSASGPSFTRFSFPNDIDINTISPEHKREGADWFALFNNSNEKRVWLDVNPVHTLIHGGCRLLCEVLVQMGNIWRRGVLNRTAQIYDVKTGVKRW